MDKHQQLLLKAKILVSLGTQVKPNIELDRLVSTALGDLAIAVLNCEHDVNYPYEMTDEEVARAFHLSKMYCINNIIIPLEETSK